MPQDPYAQIAKADPYASIAKRGDTGQGGFLSSFAEQSGLKALEGGPTALASILNSHPIDAIMNGAHWLAHASVNDARLPTVLSQPAGGIKDAYQSYKREGMTNATTEKALHAIPVVGPLGQRLEEQQDAGNYRGMAGTAAGFATSLAAPKVAGAAGRALLAGVSKASPAIASAAAWAGQLPVNALKGSELDRMIPGDVVTPRQAYNIAKSQGVQFDAAQATGSAASRVAKRTTEMSLGSNKLYDNLRTSNVNALQVHANKLLDDVAEPMSREEYGGAAKQALLGVQKSMNDKVGEMLGDVSRAGNSVQPDMTGVQQQAQQIIAQHGQYYQLHPEFLTGGTRQAWSIVKSLADEPPPVTSKTVASSILDSSGKPYSSTVSEIGPQNSWSDLHRLRTDLMDQYRGPDIAGTRAEGWLKQMTGSVDGAMTDAGSGLSGQDLAKFRAANNLYSQMKDTFDNPYSTIYHAVRAPEGIRTADLLNTANPETLRFIGQNAPQMIPQMQRQVMSKLFNPAQNETIDLGSFANRFKNANKEVMSNVLTGKQMEDAQNLARTSRLVYADANASGSGKVAQAAAEGGLIGAGALKMIGGVATGNLGQIAEGATPLAISAAGRQAAKYITNPQVVDRVMGYAPEPASGVLGDVAQQGNQAIDNPAINQLGPSAWTDLGGAKLSQHLSTLPESTTKLGLDDIEALGKTPVGARLLQYASGLKPGTKAMAALAAKAAAESQR